MSDLFDPKSFELIFPPEEMLKKHPKRFGKLYAEATEVELEIPDSYLYLLKEMVFEPFEVHISETEILRDISKLKTIMLNLLGLKFNDAEAQYCMLFIDAVRQRQEANRALSTFSELLKTVGDLQMSVDEMAIRRFGTRSVAGEFTDIFQKLMNWIDSAAPEELSSREKALQELSKTMDIVKRSKYATFVRECVNLYERVVDERIALMINCEQQHPDMLEDFELAKLKILTKLNDPNIVATLNTLAAARKMGIDRFQSIPEL